MRQCHPDEHVDDVSSLGRVRLQKRAPDRRVEEQVADLEDRAGRTAARADRGRLAAFDRDLGALGRIGLARLTAQLRHLGDRGQRLAPEPQRGDPEQVLGLGKLARRMGLERQRQVFRGHPLPAIGHPDQILPPPLHRHVDPPRTRVDRVLQQFLHHARRPLDHLAGRNLVDNGCR